MSQSATIPKSELDKIIKEVKFNLLSDFVIFNSKLNFYQSIRNKYFSEKSILIKEKDNQSKLIPFLTERNREGVKSQLEYSKYLFFMNRLKRECNKSQFEIESMLIEPQLKVEEYKIFSYCLIYNIEFSDRINCISDGYKKIFLQFEERMSKMYESL